MQLSVQHPTKGEPSEKIRQAILATAMIDALGGPTEFHKRFSFPLVIDMMPNNNFSLPSGVWTDDTSMTLCLSRSLANFVPPPSDGDTSQKGGFDEQDQLRGYRAWYRRGTLSAVGRCFDIGATIRTALDIYDETRGDIHVTLRRIQAELGEEYCSGNGSLMRVLPVGLAYWRDEILAREYARRSSRTTHPNIICQEACEVWTQVIVKIMQASNSNSSEGNSYTKLDVVKTFTDFPYESAKLREALTFPVGTPPLPLIEQEQEDHFRNHHPVLRLVEKMWSATAGKGDVGKLIPSVHELPSSGYVLHSLVAALYCFLGTDNFEDGAILAINLGNDADTVGAIYGGIAGCWYGGGVDEMSGIWSQRVKEWRSKLVKGELVVDVADELARFSAGLSGN